MNRSRLALRTRPRAARALALLASLALAPLAGCGGSSASGGAASTAAPASTTRGSGLHVTPIGGGGSTPAGSGASPSLAPAASPPAVTPSPSPTPTPAAGTLASGTFSRAFQGRPYSLRVPPGATAPLPLLVFFHGAGDDYRNFVATLQVAGWLSAADTAGVALLVPETLSPYADFADWSGNPNNDFGAMQSELDSVLALVDQDVNPTWPVDPARTHALGFSDGGLFLGVVGLSSPRFATDTILSYGWGAFEIQPTSLRTPVHMACGTADGFYPGAQATEAFLAGEGHDVLWESVPNVGHDLLGVSAGIDPAKAIAWIAARHK